MQTHTIMFQKLCSSVNHEKYNASVSTKILNVFNIDNNQKRIMMISEDHVTLKGGVMMLEILRHQLHFNRYSYRKLIIYIRIIFHNLYCISDQVNAVY